MNISGGFAHMFLMQLNSNDKKTIVDGEIAQMSVHQKISIKLYVDWH